jgi:hypothetical protein
MPRSNESSSLGVGEYYPRVRWPGEDVLCFVEHKRQSIRFALQKTQSLTGWLGLRRAHDPNYDAGYFSNVAHFSARIGPALLRGFSPLDGEQMSNFVWT